MNIPRNQGLGLIELMVTLAIIALLAVIGEPPLANMLRDNRLTAQANALNAALVRARGEAVARRGSVSICSSTDSSLCRSSSASQWEGGWIVFVDTDNNGSRASGELLLAAAGTLPTGSTLRSSGFTNAGFVRFDARGVPDSAGTFTICDTRGPASARSVAINAIGRVVRPVNASGVATSLTGGSLTCP
jgi:type IV fimbrial biogenesis protein FimT